MIPTTLITLAICLLIGLPVASTLFFLGTVLSESFSKMSLIGALGETTWTSMSGFLLVTVPLFILMGEIILRTGIAARMYSALAQWLAWLPGGLMHANIATCTVFAATSGSSAATAATIGIVAMPEINRHGYNPRLFLGTIAAGGTLGILIPPSINLIIYGVITNTSVPQLYLAGIIPGIMLSGIFMLTLLIACFIHPDWSGTRPETSWRGKFRALIDLLPPLGIFAAVIGSIYAGWATPTESAALGVVASIGLAAAYGRLNLRLLQAAFEGTLRTTAMIMLIVTASLFLNFVMAATGLVGEVDRLVSNLSLGPIQTMLLIVAFYVIVGCFMETLSLMIATLPIVAPIVFKLGFDPVWFGVIMMLLVETALITPPIGINLFVVQGVRRQGGISDVMIGSLPFVLALFAMIGILIVYPDIATFLPKIAFGR